MAFPATPLNVEVSLALGADLSNPGSWSWTDITSYVRENYRIRIRRGRSSERSTIPPSRCTLTVDNSDGRFVRLNPFGAWYGQIGVNTPLRVRVNNGSGYVTRFVGYVSGWPPSWDPSERDQTVTITADGILRRLGQGRVLKAALHRAILADNPHQFWPLDDGDEATRAASALVGGTPMTVVAAPDFAAATGPPGGASSVVDIDGGSLVASFSPPTGATGYTLEMCVALPSAPDASGVMWRLNYTNGGTLSDDANDIPVDGAFHHYLIQEEQVGADVVREIWIDGELFFTFTFVGSTLLLPNGVILNLLYSGFPIPAHMYAVALYGHANVDAAARYQAMLGYVGEMAHERVERLCAEEGVPVTVTATESQAMGAQRTNTLVALLRECAVADYGLLYEPADAAGLAYLSSSERYNLTPAITLEYDQGHIAPPWDPTDDDRDTRNDVTASRPGGSSARITDEDSVTAIGVYDDSISANVETDDQLAHVAGWAVGLGTIDELRWPAVRPNLLKHPSLIDDWMTADLGSWLAVTGHPSPLPSDDIVQVIEGYDETFGSYEYSVVANHSPATGWDIGVYGVDAAASRYGAATTFLAEDLTSVETAADVNSNGETWVTTASHPSRFPFNVDIGGLTYSCTAITGTSPNYTLTLVRLATDKAHSTGDQVTVTDTGRYGF